MSTDHTSGWPKKRITDATNTRPVMAASSTTQIASSICPRRLSMEDPLRT